MDEVLKTGYNIVLTLLESGGDNLSESDRHLLLKRSDDVSNQDKPRMSAILQSCYRGFFACAVIGHTFVPIETIKSRYGKTLDENYHGASKSFIRFATSYWTLKEVVSDFRLNNRELISTVIFQLLLTVETEIATTFFPTPGLVKFPTKLREKAQRELLQKYGESIDIDEFIMGNPILKASPSGRGCMPLILVIFMLLVFIVANVI